MPNAGEPGDLPLPPAEPVGWPQAWRLIPSQYPPINVFEHLYDSAEELAVAFALEGLTNDRLRQEVGDLTRVPRDEWVWGPGASVIMACFTHTGHPTRFSEGDFGVYYAGDTVETAVAETRHHRERFLVATQEEDLEVTMRAYVNRVRPDSPCETLFAPIYAPLLDPDDYAPSQAFGRARRANGTWGLHYPSVRRRGGTCVALFRPRALTLPAQAGHWRYVWSGREQRITDVFRIGP